MSKARDLANFVSAGNPLADGVISVGEVTGAAPIASPTFTGTVTTDGDVLMGGNITGVYRLQPQSNAMSEILLPADVDADATPLSIYAEGAAGVEITGSVLTVVTTETERFRIDSSGNVGIGTSSPATALDVAGTITSDGLNAAGELIATSYNETYVALSGTTPAVDCEAGNVFALSTSGNTTFTFSNPPASGTAYGFTLKLTAGGSHTITWPASVDWAGATAPDAPASGETDVLVFFTHDGGTTWYGFTAGQDLS